MTPDRYHETVKVSAADITALYDAVLLGMRDYIARHEQCASFVEEADPWDPGALYHALVRAGVFEDPLRFNRFSLMVEQALWQESFSFDLHAALAEVESMLTKLGVSPDKSLATQRQTHRKEE